MSIAILPQSLFCYPFATQHLIKLGGCGLLKVWCHMKHIVDTALNELSPTFNQVYTEMGRLSLHGREEGRNYTQVYPRLPARGAGSF
jgi:hypothetical protein